MITTPTVFVVGAGASCPYGLPLGEGLLKQARAITGSSDIYRLLLTLPVSDGALDEFIADLKGHPAKSLDAFLYTRQHDKQTMLIGRAVIAVLMGLSIQTVSGYETTDDWLEYLFQRMLSGCPTPTQFASSNSGLTFLTFNFDSVIETRLRRQIRAAYKGFPVDELRQAVQAIKVLHLHGLLPAPPSSPIMVGPSSVDRVLPEWTAWTQTAATSINIVHDAVTGPAINEGQGLLHNAQVICFLGFRYQQENLDRLDVLNIVNKATDEKVVYGSAMGLPAGEVDGLKNKFRAINLNIKLDSQSCREALLNYHVFRD